MANNVYTANWVEPIPAGGDFITDFSILSVNRRIKIKSITWELYVVESISGNRIDLQATQKIKPYLQLFVNTFARAFKYISGVQITLNGTQIDLYRPGQWFFDSFFITNELFGTILIRNSLAVPVTIETTLIIETEEENIYLQ